MAVTTCFFEKNYILRFSFKGCKTQMRTRARFLKIIRSCATPFPNNCWDYKRTSVKLIPAALNFKISQHIYYLLLKQFNVPKCVNKHEDLSSFRCKTELLRFPINARITFYKFFASQFFFLELMTYGRMACQFWHACPMLYAPALRAGISQKVYIVLESKLLHCQVLHYSVIIHTTK